MRHTDGEEKDKPRERQKGKERERETIENERGLELRAPVAGLAVVLEIQRDRSIVPLGQDGNL